MEIENAVVKAAEQLRYAPLKEEQQQCITDFVRGKDIFIVLPTGFGKTVCYACLPKAFDLYLSKTCEDSSIIVVISPLISLMKDQVRSLNEHNVNAGYIDAESDYEVKQNVNEGKYNVIFMSPELMVGKWRGLFSNQLYKERLIGLVVDEAHCVIKWGLSFREAFLRIKEVRSLMSPNLHIMALTATATRSLRSEVQQMLGMIEPVVVVRSPDKINMRYTNIKLTGSNACSNEIFAQLLAELQAKRTSLDRVIIFCKNKTDCAKLYAFFESNLGPDFTEPPGVSESILECRLVDMFFKGTESTVKMGILANFTKPSPLRIVIATVAFGMGVDCPDVRLIIHLGPPSDLESYVQEVGRGGRDGSASYAVLLYSSKLSVQCSEHMIHYVENTSTCRRDMLYAHFDNFSHSPYNVGCKCCDICAKTCECTHCHDSSYTFLPSLFGMK